MTTLPNHVQSELERLIGENLPAEEIAFMMRLDVEYVKAEIQRLKKVAART